MVLQWEGNGPEVDHQLESDQETCVLQNHKSDLGSNEESSEEADIDNEHPKGDSSTVLKTDDTT